MSYLSIKEINSGHSNLLFSPHVFNDSNCSCLMESLSLLVLFDCL